MKLERYEQGVQEVKSGSTGFWISTFFTLALALLLHYGVVTHWGWILGVVYGVGVMWVSTQKVLLGKELIRLSKPDQIENRK